MSTQANYQRLNKLLGECLALTAYDETETRTQDEIDAAMRAARSKALVIVDLLVYTGMHREIEQRAMVTPEVI